MVLKLPRMSDQKFGIGIGYDQNPLPAFSGFLENIFHDFVFLKVNVN